MNDWSSVSLGRSGDARGELHSLGDVWLCSTCYVVPRFERNEWVWAEIHFASRS